MPISDILNGELASSVRSKLNSVIPKINRLDSSTKEQDLGSITGAVEIDFTAGQYVVANPTGELTLTSATGASVGHVLDFDLYFDAIQTINWPANTVFLDGAAPDPSTAPYRIVGSVDENNVITIDGVIDGSDGQDAFVYVAYASDDQGTGFSLTPSDSLDYIAVLSTDTEIPSPSAGDFTGLWTKYQATNGVPAGGTDGQVLKKASATDYDTVWEDEAGGSELTWRQKLIGSEHSRLIAGDAFEYADGLQSTLASGQSWTTDVQITGNECVKNGSNQYYAFQHTGVTEKTIEVDMYCPVINGYGGIIISYVDDNNMWFVANIGDSLRIIEAVSGSLNLRLNTGNIADSIAYHALKVHCVSDRITFIVDGELVEYSVPSGSELTSYQAGLDYSGIVHFSNDYSFKNLKVFEL